jgi:hypothetical protein
MTPEDAKRISAKFNNQEGQLLGLRAILASLLASNPNLKVDEVFIGRLILGWPLDGNPNTHEDVRIAARATMHGIIARKVP